MLTKESFDNLISRTYEALNSVSLARKYIGIERLELTGEWEVIVDSLNKDSGSWYTGEHQKIVDGVFFWLDYLSNNPDPEARDILFIDDFRWDIEDYLNLQHIKSKDTIDKNKYLMTVSKEYIKTIEEGNKKFQLEYILDKDYLPENDVLVGEDDNKWGTFSPEKFFIGGF